MKMADNEEGSL